MLNRLLHILQLKRSHLIALFLRVKALLRTVMSSALSLSSYYLGLASHLRFPLEKDLSPGSFVGRTHFLRVAGLRTKENRTLERVS